MTKVFKVFCLLTLATLFTSCDPVHDIYFINNSNSETKIRMNLFPKSKQFDLREVATGDSIVFNLKPIDTANICFGIGTWSEDEIATIAQAIKNIEIETKDTKTIYKSQKSINEILDKNRAGLFGQTEINIIIE